MAEAILGRPNADLEFKSFFGTEEWVMQLLHTSRVLLVACSQK